MRLFRKRKIEPVSDWITANEALRLSKATKSTGYNVADSIREKANAGGRKLYVNPEKLSPEVLTRLKADYKVRVIKDDGGRITYVSIEW